MQKDHCGWDIVDAQMDSERAPIVNPVEMAINDPCCFVSQEVPTVAHVIVACLTEVQA